MGLLLSACAAELGASPSSPPALGTPALGAANPHSSASETPSASAGRQDRRGSRGARAPTNERFVAWHLGAGVASTLVVQAMTYSIAGRVGHSGQGLGPAIGALAIGAFAPPILNYTVAWMVGRGIAPGRDKFWPGFLVRQAAHLGIFAGLILGGADFTNPGQLAAIVAGEAVVTSGLATMTAELTRRPQLSSPSSAALDNPSPRPVQIVVPVLELQF